MEFATAGGGFMPCLSSKHPRLLQAQPLFAWCVHRASPEVHVSCPPAPTFCHMVWHKKGQEVRVGRGLSRSSFIPGYEKAVLIHLASERACRSSANPFCSQRRTTTSSSQQNHTLHHPDLRLHPFPLRPHPRSSPGWACGAGRIRTMTHILQHRHCRRFRHRVGGAT
jgi:hypothetical protein